jgi:hypothetical protein
LAFGIPQRPVLRKSSDAGTFYALRIPALAAALGGYHLDIDPIATCVELVFLVGGAFVASVAAKRFAGAFIRQNPEAMTE